MTDRTELAAVKVAIDIVDATLSDESVSAEAAIVLADFARAHLACTEGAEEVEAVYGDAFLPFINVEKLGTYLLLKVED